MARKVNAAYIAAYNEAARKYAALKQGQTAARQRSAPLETPSPAQRVAQSDQNEGNSAAMSMPWAQGTASNEGPVEPKSENNPKEKAPQNLIGAEHTALRALFGGSMTKDDLRRGIIMAEVLGPPAAKRRIGPHKFR